MENKTQVQFDKEAEVPKTQLGISARYLLDPKLDSAMGVQGAGQQFPAQGPARVYPDTWGYASAPPPPPGAYYNVTNQPLPPPATYQERPKRGRSPCCCLLTGFIGVLTIFGIIAGAYLLVFWTIVQPRDLKFDVDNVVVSGLNVNSSSASAPINTNVTFQLVAHNPNKKIGIYYDEIDVNVQTQDVTIGDGNLLPFYQGHKNTTTLNVIVSEQHVNVDSDTLAHFTGDNASNVLLHVDVDAKVRAKIGSSKSNTKTIKIRCNINVDLTSTNPVSQVLHRHCTY